jgi:hypothetical protein
LRQITLPVSNATTQPICCLTTFREL